MEVFQTVFSTITLHFLWAGYSLEEMIEVSDLWVGDRYSSMCRP